MVAAMVSCIPRLHIQLRNNPGLKIIILSLLIPIATSMSFYFTTFTPNDRNIIYERSATSANGTIQLTRNQLDSSTQASIGRATYAQPLHLWDRASGNLTDFLTNFTFVINSRNRTRYGDGMTFFLAPNGSRIPEGSTRGGSLGLTAENQRLNSTDNPFVAVEFDIFPNNDDPQYNHVGIDINSMRSIVTVPWSSNVGIMEGREHEARIRYDSNSRNLSVNFIGFNDDGSYISQGLTYIVDLREYLPEFVTFGFSAATGGYSALHSINSWNFSSILEANGNDTDTGTVAPPGFRSDSSNIGLVIGLAVGGPVFLMILGLLIYFLWNKRNKMMNEAGESGDVSLADEFDRVSGPKKLSYNVLKRATNFFADKLGEGGFGQVYKGFLSDINSYVAVKRVSSSSNQGRNEYASEVKTISRLRHKNLVQLIGWCHEENELLLVYEFMPNGSLDSHLFKGKSLLNWENRYKIALGLASALLYLQEGIPQCVLHRDIKSSNVMLDANFDAKLGDFGLARLVDPEKGSQTTGCVGTWGYIAPEYRRMGKASKKTDVFSFGVVALEICCGRKPIDNEAEECRVILVEWVWSLYGMGRILDAVDPLLGSDFDEREMEQLMILGLSCACPDSDRRPSIREANLVLNFGAPLPVLPLRMPSPTKCIPPMPDVDMVSSSYETETVLTGR